jgi:competence/damage-inducible protein CinA-like protein
MKRSGPVASVLLIGDELVIGEIEDRNGPFFAEQLTDQGFQIDGIRLLPDDVESIAKAVGESLRHSRLVVVCGGLGPTSDDRTTEAVGQALGRRLSLDREHWERIRQIFALLRGEEPPPGNEKQAQIPEGADALLNEMGTALGYVVREGSRAVAVLPGPPKENQRMFEKQFLPWLGRNMPDRSPWATRLFRVFGLPESEVGHRLREVEAEYVDIRVSYRFHFPEILVKLRCGAESEDRLRGAAIELERRLAPHLYSTGEERLPAVLGRELERQGLRIVTAESCTGGLVAKLLTDTPGSSAWMERGFVVYSNEAKEQVLGVPKAMLEQFGAVSETVALSMLVGALERSDAQICLAITGIAGPGGGTIGRPVGTVWLAWGDREERHTETHQFRWDREYNRLLSAWAGMHRVYQHLLARGTG